MKQLILIEGTDCSGKETQTKLLQEHLIQDGYDVMYFSFPNYESATGKIIGDCYLGRNKEGISYFEEDAGDVDPYVSSLYYAADRKYNIAPILEALKHEKIVLLDRYVPSNMAHQCGKIEDAKKRKEMYRFIEMLEYDLLGLPRPDLVLFLHLPQEYSIALKQKRKQKCFLDQLEKNTQHLFLAEQAYRELSEIFGWKKIECVSNGTVKSIDKIHEEVYNIVTQC